MSADLPGIEDWRKLVSESLKGRDLDSLRSKTRDGIEIEPLYERRRNGQPLADRGGRPWAIVQPVDDPDPDRANEQAIADIKGGATGVLLRFSGAPSAGGLGLPPTQDALRATLDGIDLAAIRLQLEPHSQSLNAAEWLKDLILASGIAPERADVAFGFDPVAVMAIGGAVPDPRTYAAAILSLREAHFREPFALADVRPWHEAGASEAQELGALLGVAAWWLRAFDEAGVASEETLALLGASLSVDRDLLMSLAKLRAARLLWARFQELCGAPPSPLPIHAETSRRMLTCADPHANLLRNTLAAFAAVTGGADSILVQPHTAALGPADAEARALARSIQHILMQEAHLDQVADPGAGSGAIEALTDALAERAWAEFQKIEREGGIVESFRSGALPARIAEARNALIKDVASGDAPLVGSTLYSAEPSAVADESAVEAPSGLAPIRLEALAKAAA